MGEQDQQEVVAAAVDDDLRLEDWLVIWAVRPLRWIFGKLPPWLFAVIGIWLVVSLMAVGTGQAPRQPIWLEALLVSPAAYLGLIACVMILSICMKILLWPFRTLWMWIGNRWA